MHGSEQITEALWSSQWEKVSIYFFEELKQTVVPLGGVSSMLLISQKPTGKMEGDVPW